MRRSTVRLVPGESLTMYTDGLNEAVNEAGAFYTIERIRKQIQADPGCPLRARPEPSSRTCATSSGRGRKATTCAWSRSAVCA